MSEGQLSIAYWLWLRPYLVETTQRNCGSLKTARCALFLTLAEVASRSKATKYKILNLEKREDNGSATLEAMTKASDAMGCEFISAIVPTVLEGSEPKDISQVIWEKILPRALEDRRVKAATEKQKSRVLASVAKELMMSAEFRREQKWTPRKA
jgi:hypothetical protein